MKIIFARHAEVIQTHIGKYNGHIDIPLSQNGKNQAKELAKKLQSEKFDRIYCSDLLRARETLDAFEFSRKPIYTDKLREKSWGKHEGKSFDEILSEGIEYKNFEQWLSALDGEDITDYKNRVEKYFNEVLVKDTAKNILVITHSGFIKTLIGIIKESSLEKAFCTKIPYSSFIIYNKLKNTYTIN
ncbi:MAG: histidine phosphatase family protein [Campylobacterota bacterium]|nr:histidine phosphatase family protein [Campylobacterota bacterium]